MQGMAAVGKLTSGAPAWDGSTLYVGRKEASDELTFVLLSESGERRPLSCEELLGMHRGIGVSRIDWSDRKVCGAVMDAVKRQLNG